MNVKEAAVNFQEAAVNLREATGYTQETTGDPQEDTGDPQEATGDPQEVLCSLLTPAGLLALADRSHDRETVACHPCTMCDLVFSSKEQFRSHTEQVHNGENTTKLENRKESSLSASGRPILLTPNFVTKHKKFVNTMK